MTDKYTIGMDIAIYYTGKTQIIDWSLKFVVFSDILRMTIFLKHHLEGKSNQIITMILHICASQNNIL